MTADRPATKPRTEAGRYFLELLPGFRADHISDGKLALMHVLAIEAEAAQGAAPRAEGLDVERLIWRLIESYPGGVEIDNVQRFREHVRTSLSRPSDERVPESEER